MQGMAGSIPQAQAKPEGFIGKDLSANGEHFIFGSKSQFEPEGNNNGTDLSIYDRDLKTDETKVVSKTPSGQTMTGSGIGELDISSDGSHILIGQLVSEVGSAKYWHLYMNAGDSSKTTELTPGAKEGVLFDGMTSDGSKVFFSSEEHLTGEEEAHSGPDIYMWEEGKPLTLISKGETETPGQPGDSASCDPASNTKHVHWNTTGSEENCGDVAIGGGGGVASEGGTIYFLSPELLDGTEEPHDGVKNAPNLYVVRPGSAPHFVATLESSANARCRPSPIPSCAPSAPSNGPRASRSITPTATSTCSTSRAEMGGGTGREVRLLRTSGDQFRRTRRADRPRDGGQRRPCPVSSRSIQSTGDLYVPDFSQSGVQKYNSSGSRLARDRSAAVPAASRSIRPTETYMSASFRSNPEYAYLITPVELVNQFPTILRADGRRGQLSGDRLRRHPVVANPDARGDHRDLRLHRATTYGQLDANPSFGVAVDPSDNDVYVDEGNQVSEFDSAGNPIGTAIGSGLLTESISLAADSGTLPSPTPASGRCRHCTDPPLCPRIPSTDNPLVVDSVTSPESRNSADFQVTPSGDYAVFTSALSLTGYDNAAHREIFRYDATNRKLECASCNPDL